MSSFNLYSFDEMLVKERQDDLWRQMEQARQRHLARQVTPRERPNFFRVIREYLGGWRQTLRPQERSCGRLETYEPTPRMRHAAS
jgi:hypothetical protein